MKRVKTIISISIVLFSLCNIYSCREDEMDIIPENKTSVVKTNQERNFESKKTDSSNATTNLLFDENGNQIADPPPRDKDQWRIPSQEILGQRK